MFPSTCPNCSTRFAYEPRREGRHYVCSSCSWMFTAEEARALKPEPLKARTPERRKVKPSASSVAPKEIGGSERDLEDSPTEEPRRRRKGRPAGVKLLLFGVIPGLLVVGVVIVFLAIGRRGSAAERDPDYRSGEVLLNKKDYGPAAEKFSKVIAKYPDDPRPHLKRALCYTGVVKDVFDRAVREAQAAEEDISPSGMGYLTLLDIPPSPKPTRPQPELVMEGKKLDGDRLFGEPKREFEKAADLVQNQAAFCVSGSCGSQW